MIDVILKQLIGTSSVHHISANVLESATGLSSDDINTTLDALYEKRIINQATITRNGITCREVWLTGVIQKIPPTQYVINPNKAQKAPPAAVIAEPVPTIASAKPTTSQDEKSWALKLLELIEKHPGINQHEAAQMLNYKYVSTALIPGYIDRGDVIAEKNQDGKLTFKLKQGMTAADVYNRRKRASEPRKPKPAEASNFLAVPTLQSDPLPETYEQLLKQTSDEFNAPEINIESPLLSQVGGSHYKDMAIQPITYILANNIGFAEGSIIKYISRYKAKNGLQDLKKARHFIDILIEHAESAT
ncbi:MAG: DUF3310 domain-containing protein [Methylophilaceae bacterium]